MSASDDEQAFAEIYRELRAAARQMRARNPQRTLNTTALVNEAWLKLNAAETGFQNRLHYLSTAALAMRQILVDYARYRGAARRDRDVELPLIETGIEDLTLGAHEDVLALDAALSDLEALDPQASHLVVLRFFGGLQVDEAAEVLEISERTAARAWIRARAFLNSRLSP